MIFYQNTFYNYVFGTFKIEIPSTRSGYKNNPQTGKSFPNPITDGVHKFRNSIETWLKQKPDKTWPCKCRLLVAIQFGLTSKGYKDKDIDNITKSLIDALKGVVYNDDQQIDCLHVTKYKSEQNSFMVGIKKLTENNPAWYFPPLYSEKLFPKIQKYCFRA